MEKIKEWIVKAADWVSSHKWDIILVALLMFFAAGAWARYLESSREVSALRSAYAQSVEQVKQLEDKVTSLRAALDRKQEEIYRLQQEHDRKIREVTADAYHKARTLSDDELLAAYNKLISGARSRNAERERRTDTSAEE